MVHTYLCSPLAIHPSIVATASSRVSTLTGTPNTCGRGCIEPSSPNIHEAAETTACCFCPLSVDDFSFVRWGRPCHALAAQSARRRGGDGNRPGRRRFSKRAKLCVLATEAIEVA